MSPAAARKKLLIGKLRMTSNPGNVIANAATIIKRRIAGSGINSVENVLEDNGQFRWVYLLLQQITDEFRIWKRQKRVKCRFFHLVGPHIPAIEITHQQLVEFAHAAPALPA